MMKLVVIAMLALAASPAESCRPPVKYGDLITIENQYSGNWMLQRNGDPSFTTDSARISNQAAQWKILDTNLQTPNRAVRYGDKVVLENQYSGKWKLQRNGGVDFAEFSSAWDYGLNNEQMVWSFIWLGDGDFNVLTPNTEEVLYGDYLAIQNQYSAPSKYFLQRSGSPSFTTDMSRFTNRAAEWRIENLQRAIPTCSPTAKPTKSPTKKPTAEPTADPTADPTAEPTADPTADPTAEPTSEPTNQPDVEAQSLSDLAGGWEVALVGQDVYKCNGGTCRVNSAGSRNRWNTASRPSDASFGPIGLFSEDTGDGQWSFSDNALVLTFTGDRRVFTFPVTCSC